MTVRRERVSQGRAGITRLRAFATSTRGTYYAGDLLRGGSTDLYYLEGLDADSRTGCFASRRYVPGEQP